MNKLCYICEATQGGVRKHLRELIRTFAQPAEGFEVYGIFGDRGEPGFTTELQQLAESGRFQYFLVPQLCRPIRPWRDAQAYRHIQRTLREIQPDLVHTHSSKAGILGRYAAHHLGLETLIHTPHVFPFQWAQGWRARLYLELERRAARFCQALVCVGEGQRAQALSAGVCPPQKLHVIRNGMEIPAPHDPEARRRMRTSLGLSLTAPVVGMVARLAPQKGVNAFVRAAALVCRRRPEVVFLLVGSGPLEDQIRARLRELQLPEGSFRLLGHREDTQALYPAFDLLVLSSLYEGLPYVLLEAMACGLPVVATDVLGSRDVVVHGETGFLARANDEAQIAECILTAMAGEQLRERLGRAARRRVAEQFSFAAFVTGHRQLYAALLKGKQALNVRPV